jgi:hypothetical protein
MNIDVEAELESLLNIEIARELLLTKDPNLTEETFNIIWSKCNNNPYNAPVLWELFLELEEKESDENRNHCSFKSNNK